MSTPEVVDGSVVEDAPSAPDMAGQNLPVRRERRSEVIRPLSSNDLIASFDEYQKLLPNLLSPEDYQDAGFDKKTGKQRKFVKKSGWRKIATAFDLDLVRVHDEIERDETGQPVRAMAVWRAVAPSGRAMEGDGYCSVEEDRFKKPGSRAKLENDLRATATTRAKNRAISDLVGMGEVSAEEVSDGPIAVSLPVWAERVTPEVKAQAGIAWNAIVAALGATPEQAGAAWQAVGQAFGGTMPQGFATAMAGMAQHLTAGDAS